MFDESYPMKTLPLTLLPHTTSTNLVAMDALRAGAPNGACWIADAQSGGRGRREVGGSARAWFSPSGVNLYTSIVLRPMIEPQRASTLTLAVAVGVARAIEQHTESSIDVRIKWPNDLYIGEKKLAGILTEAAFDGLSLNGVVVGLGLNVNMLIEDAPEDLQDKVTSLREQTGCLWDRLSLGISVRDHIVRVVEEVARDGLTCVMPELRARDHTLGKQLQWMHQGTWRQGVARGMNALGQLHITDEQGQTHEMSAGEVRFKTSTGGWR